MVTPTHKLKKKGWSKKEITHAQKIIKKAKNDPNKDKTAEIISYIIAMIIGIVSNIFISLFVIPLVVMTRFTTSSNILIIMVVGVLGLVFGLLFSLIIKDLDHLTKHHHISAIFIIPIIGFISFTLITKRLESLTQGLGSYTWFVQNPSLIGVVFVTLFILPYAYTLYKITVKD